MRTRKLGVLASSCVMVLLGGACSDGGSAAPGSSTGGAGAATQDTGGSGGSAGAGGSGTAQTTAEGADTVAVRVFRQVGLPPYPLAVGATVALDPPSGVRVEKATDEDGRAVFGGLDLTAPASVIAYLEGHGFHGQGGISAKTGEVALWLRPIAEQSDLVTVSGSATGLVSATHSLGVYPTSTGSVGYFGAAPDYAVQVPPAQPFRLIGVEVEPGEPPSPRGFAATIFGWTATSSEALSDDATLPVDFGAPLPKKKIAGTLAMPGDPTLAKLGTASFRVSAVENLGLFLGGPTVIDVAEDGTSFELEGEYVPLDGITPLTSYVIDAGGGALARVAVHVSGYPDGGALEMPFLDPPELIEPEGAGPHPLHGPLVWSLPEGTYDEVSIGVVGANGARSRMLFPPDTESGAIPELPSTADPAKLFGGGAQLYVNVCDTLSEGPLPEPFCQRYAAGRIIEATP